MLHTISRPLFITRGKATSQYCLLQRRVPRIREARSTNPRHKQIRYVVRREKRRNFCPHPRLGDSQELPTRFHAFPPSRIPTRIANRFYTRAFSHSFPVFPSRLSARFSSRHHSATVSKHPQSRFSFEFAHELTLTDHESSSCRESVATSSQVPFASPSFFFPLRETAKLKSSHLDGNRLTLNATKKLRGSKEQQQDRRDHVPPRRPAG